MRLHFTIALIVLNLAVFWVIYFIDLRSDAGEVFENEPTAILGSFINDLDSLEIRVHRPEEVAGQRTLEVRGERWMLTEPVRWPANELAVESILNQLQELDVRAVYRVDEMEESGYSLASYGLDDPVVELTYGRRASDGQERKEGTLRIGSLNLGGNNVHMLGPNRERILVVDRGLLDSLSVGLESIRDQRVFRVEPYEIQGVAIEVNPREDNGETPAAPQRVRIEKEDEAWRFKSPFDAPAEELQVGPLITQLTGLRVKRFVDGADLDAAGLDKPFMRVTLVPNLRDFAQSLLIGSPDPEAEDSAYFAKLAGNDTVFTVGTGVPDYLTEAQVTLRERSFLGLDRRMLDAVTVRRGDKEVVLQKLETGRWVVIDPSAGSTARSMPADAEVMENLMRTLENLEAQAFVSDAPGADLGRFGLDDPRATVVLRGERTRTLLLGSPPGQVMPLYAKTEAEPFVYEVLAEVLNRLSVSRLHYRDRMLVQQPASARVRSIALRDVSGDAVVVERSIDPQSQTWPTALEEEPPGRREAILGLVDAVKQLRVKDYLSDEFSMDFRHGDGKALPWAYVLEAEVMLPGGESDEVRTVRYYFTRKLSGQTQVGGAPEPGMVFTLPQKLIDALFKLTFGREPLPEPPVMRPSEEPAEPPAMEAPES